MNTALQHECQPAGKVAPAWQSRLSLVETWWTRVLIALLGCWLGSVNSAGAEASGLKEYQLKAAFLYNFTKFVEWPAACFESTDAPIILGVAGKGPCAAELEQVVKDRAVNGRKLVVKTLATPGDADGVHVLFVPASEDSRLPEWLEATRVAGVLTVGESEAFARADGIIRFVIEGDKVRFEINMSPAEQAGLKISAQLLKLARTVRRKS